ncbi:DNA primase [Candidatus Zinderia insecticola CARI]|uniref:DNA primase n=1 Tax=Zinderia insecticola (strain CARI) TaxID=871271 RepID=E0TIT3_ZINIC|nr:DNA primase [Candidatus Zinderia insecticola CARI]
MFKKYIKLINKKYNILNIIKKYVFLKKIGNNYFGLCPFHKEKTPSFCVNLFKKYFYCFGCNFGGDMISFLMKYKKEKFINIINILLKKNIFFKKNSDEEKIFLIYEKINLIYKKELKKNYKAKKYIKLRNINKKIIKKFNLGYSKNINKKFKFIKKKYNFIYKNINILKNRIIFPIRNLNGKIIAFGGRSINNNYKNKYINTYENFIFKKKKEFYGLYENLKHIKKKKYVIIVEGYIDLLTLFQFGFLNTISILGTNFTKYHFKKITKITNKIIFIFDGDIAGNLAINKVLNLCLSLSLKNKIISFVILPYKYDPDNYLRKYGILKFKKKIENSISLFNLLINKIINNNNIRTLQGRINILYNFKNIVNNINEDFIILQIINLISKILNIKINYIIKFILKKKINYEKRKVYYVKNINKEIILLYNIIKFPFLIKKINLNILYYIKNRNRIIYIILKKIKKIYYFVKFKNFLNIINFFRKKNNIFNEFSYKKLKKNNIDFNYLLNKIKLEIIKNKIYKYYNNKIINKKKYKNLFKKWILLKKK